MSTSGETIRVLHVDDEPDLADVVATYLEREDDRLTVRTATSASDGLDVLADHSVECIVSDYDMPGLNGIEFLEAVREEYPDLPFVLYTGKGSEEVAADAISAGVTDYLQKETGTDQYAVLANRVTNAVESYRSQRALARRNRDLRRYKQMVDSMQESACIYDEDGRFVVVNEHLADWYGTTPDALEGEESALVPAIRAEAEDTDADPYRALLDGEREQVAGEVTSEFPGHGEAVLAYQLTPLAVDGSVDGVVGVARDVTERTEREAELRRIERRYRAVFDDPNILVTLLDTDGTVLDVNQTAMEYVDATVDDVTGEAFRETPWFDRSASVRQSVDAWVERAAAGEYVEFEAGPQRPDGESYTIEGVFRPVTDDDGEVVSLLVSGRDVTERTERERELNRYEAYLEGSTDIITVVDESGVIRYQSPAVERILGYESAEFVGRNGFDFVHPDDVDEVAATFADLLSNPGGTATIECRFRTADDEWRWLEIRGTNRLDEDAIQGVVTNNRDITDRKRREQELQRERDRLDEFASVVSHDLRNPLNVVGGRIEIASEECDSEHLDAAQTAVDRMERIIEDVLWLAREGRDIRSVEPVAVRDAVEDAWSLVADGADGAELQYASDDGSTSTVEADFDRFQQLLENLLGNAIEHGGDDVTVTVGGFDDGFYVADDGPGIPADERDDVFDPGYSTGEEGTGFGLSIVERVAEAHGWTVRVTESADGGARFEVTDVTLPGETT